MEQALSTKCIHCCTNLRSTVARSTGPERTVQTLYSPIHVVPSVPVPPVLPTCSAPEPCAY